VGAPTRGFWPSQNFSDGNGLRATPQGGHPGIKTSSFVWGGVVSGTFNAHPWGWVPFSVLPPTVGGTRDTPRLGGLGEDLFRCCSTKWGGGGFSWGRNLENPRTQPTR